MSICLQVNPQHARSKWALWVYFIMIYPIDLSWQNRPPPGRDKIPDIWPRFIHIFCAFYYMFPILTGHWHRHRDRMTDGYMRNVAYLQFGIVSASSPGNSLFRISQILNEYTWLPSQRWLSPYCSFSTWVDLGCYLHSNRFSLTPLRNFCGPLTGRKTKSELLSSIGLWGKFVRRLRALRIHLPTTSKRFVTLRRIPGEQELTSSVCPHMVRKRGQRLCEWWGREEGQDGYTWPSH